MLMASQYMQRQEIKSDTQCDLSRVKTIGENLQKRHAQNTVKGGCLWVGGPWMIFLLFFPPFWVFPTLGNDCWSAVGNVCL